MTQEQIEKELEEINREINEITVNAPVSPNGQYVLSLDKLDKLANF